MDDIRAKMKIFKVLGSETRGYFVKDRNSNIDVIVTVGTDVILSFPYSEGQSNEFEAFMVTGIRETLMWNDPRPPFKTPAYEVSLQHMELLLKYKEVGRMGIKDAVKFVRDCRQTGYESNFVESQVGMIAEPSTFNKIRLSENICYIFKDDPSTNSLALSKQFDIKSKHVLESLFVICRNQPSLYSQMLWNIYSEDNKVFHLYLEITEVLYRLKYLEKGIVEMVKDKFHVDPRTYILNVQRAIYPKYIMEGDDVVEKAVIENLRTYNSEKLYEDLITQIK